MLRLDEQVTRGMNAINYKWLARDLNINVDIAKR